MKDRDCDERWPERTGLIQWRIGYLVTTREPAQSVSNLEKSTFQQTFQSVEKFAIASSKLASKLDSNLFRFKLESPLWVLNHDSCVISPSSTPVVDITRSVALYNVDK